VSLRVGVPADEAERLALAEVQALCFRAPVERLLLNFGLVGHENLRVVRDGSRIVGGLTLVPMGQWFGGRALPMTGIAAVGIRPEARGGGAGGLLVRSVVAELAAQGVPLSTLYPATVPVYRAAGFELAGSRWHVRLHLKGLPTRAPRQGRTAGGGPTLRAGGPDDFPAMERAYRHYACHQDGLLDRGHFVWTRVRMPRGETAQHYLVEDPDAPGPAGPLLGYLSYTQREAHDFLQELVVSDLALTTASAGERLIALLGAHQSLAPVALLNLPPRHPLLTLLPEWRAETRLHLHWMLRLCALDAALEGRGYPAGLTAALHLDVADALVPANAGRRVLSIADGSGHVERGGQGSLRLDVGALAALFSGFQSPEELALQGGLVGPPAGVGAAAAAFSGPAPWMQSIF